MTWTYGAIIVAIICADGQPAAGTVDFDTQILPILTRSGCNAGACHGSASGRGGFKLSLYGGDPDADFLAITRQWEGRRINVAFPQKSLLFKKPTGLMDHEGGELFEPDSRFAAVLLNWIDDGALRLGQRQLANFAVLPKFATVHRPGDRLQLSAQARFQDQAGEELQIEDVTDWTVFTAEDTASVSIDENGVTTVHRPGRHIVLARFLDMVVPVEVILPFTVREKRIASSEKANFVDRHILEKLAVLGIPTSPTCDDATYIRRVSLDFTGSLPTPKDVEAFLGDQRADKRERLCDRLLHSPQFVRFWTYRLANVLRIRSQPMDPEGALAFHQWLSGQIEQDRPYPELVRELLLASGDTHEYGPANFYRAAGDARSQAEYVTEALMGVRLRCANCHNHPLDRWTQDDYHGLAAIFARIERGRHVRILPYGEVTHPRTGQAARPRIPGERFLEPSADPRQPLADWLTASDNPYLYRALVNRLWHWMTGRGLVHPVDDLRASNPATHPELLDALTKDFMKNGCSIRHTLRVIATSMAYARRTESRPENEFDDRYYSRALVRPLEAEVLADAVSFVTGVPSDYRDQPAGTLAVELHDPNIASPALDILGRCFRREGCDAGPSTGGLTRTLHLLNGEWLNQKICSPSGRLHQLLASGMSDQAIIDALYLVALSRNPTTEELHFWMTRSTGDDRTAWFEDFLWSLLTCREFVTNH